MKTVDAVEIFKCLKDFYQGLIEEEIIEVLKDTNDIFVLREMKSDIKIAIERKNLVPSNRKVIAPFKEFTLWQDLKNYNFGLDNRKLTFFKAKGFYITNTAEFLFRYEKIQNELPDSEMKNFKIGDVEFEIGEPSELFKVLFHHISKEEHFEWEDFHTIKLKNINKEMIEVYLQNAMYIINKNAPSNLVGDYPHVYQYLYTHDYIKEIEEIIEGEVSNNFRMGKYANPIAFYNEGKQKRDFLSYYKVLEYFLIINRKDDLEAYITAYNRDKNLDRMINNISGIYGEKERELIQKLINKIENIEPILELAFSKGLISKQDDKTEFANKLYDYRNSRVHGKKEKSFKLIVPAILNLDDSMEWEIIIENLAGLVILQFCYS
ncbi:hypothetical protein [Bacillus cereus group sp. BfR-BA-01330]|uniref:hypothetical protein n=1 Tax=Bacillus cereus group sp. BfR-BA-01330 TaxID=2920306 RepID=UPI001F5784B1